MGGRAVTVARRLCFVEYGTPEREVAGPRLGGMPPCAAMPYVSYVSRRVRIVCGGGSLPRPMGSFVRALRLRLPPGRTCLSLTSSSQPPSLFSQREHSAPARPPSAQVAMGVRHADWDCDRSGLPALVHLLRDHPLRRHVHPQRHGSQVRSRTGSNSAPWRRRVCVCV